MENFIVKIILIYRKIMNINLIQEKIQAAYQLIDENEISSIDKQKDEYKRKLKELKLILKKNFEYLEQAINETKLIDKSPVISIETEKDFLIFRTQNLIEEFERNKRFSSFQVQGLEQIKEMIKQNDILSLELDKKIEEAKQQHTPKIYQAEKEIADTKEKINQIKSEIISCQDKINIIYLRAANQLARRVVGTKIAFAQDPVIEIEEIKKIMSHLSLEKLQSYWIDHQETIKTLLTKIKSESSTGIVGKDARNCSLLVNSGEILNTPQIILALFALQAAAEKNDQTAKELIEVERENYTLAGMLEWGLKGNKILQLETLPVNLGAKLQKKTYILEYIRRKNIQQTFIPIIKSIHEAYSSLQPKLESKEFCILNKNEKAYSIQNWKEYESDFKELTKKIDEAVQMNKTADLVANAGKWPLHKLINQSRIGMCDLIKNMHIEHSVEKEQFFREILTIEIKATLDELVTKISSSIELLNPNISHNFDRLHWISTLMDTDKYILTSDGKWSGRDILERVVEKFAVGISEENVIAAEQFYVRTQLALSTVNKI